MNLLFRLCWLLLISRRHPASTALGPCQTPFRVLPTDLDILRHVNNGKYFSLMDLARVDMITRGGLTPHLRREGWFPVVTAETIQLRRSLRLFQAFHIETRVVGWDDLEFVLEQRFTRNTKVVATAVVRTRFLSRTGLTIAPRTILEVLDLPLESPTLPPHIARWNADQARRPGRAEPSQASSAA